MKKLLSIILSAALLTACVQTPDNVKSKPDSAGSSNAELYTEGAITYSDDLLIKTPQYEKLCTFTLTQKKLPQSEALKVFDSFYEKYCAERMKGMDKQIEQRFMGYELMDTEKQYPQIYPAVSDYKNDIISEKVKADLLFVDNLKVYLEVLNGQLSSLNKGHAFEYLRQKGMATEQSSIGVSDPTWYCAITAKYFTDSDDKVKLADGEISITQAKKKALEYVRELCGETELKPVIPQVFVVDMKGQQGLSFVVTGEYEGVPLDAHEMKTVGAMGYDGYSNGNEYENMPAAVFMMSSDSIDSILANPCGYEVNDINETKQRLTLRQALKITDEKFSQQVKLKIYRAELVYTKQVIKDESGEPKEYKCRPAWKFSANPASSASRMFVYVDIINGDCYCYESRENKGR